MRDTVGVTGRKSKNLDYTREDGVPKTSSIRETDVTEEGRGESIITDEKRNLDSCS